MQIVTDIFAVISSAITNFANALTSALTSVTSLFYTPGVEGGAGSMTFLGVLALIATGVGIVYFGIRFVLKLIRKA